jgi:hypothetical protein
MFMEEPHLALDPTFTSNITKTLTFESFHERRREEIKHSTNFLKFNRFMRKHDLKLAMGGEEFEKIDGDEEKRVAWGKRREKEKKIFSQPRERKG